MEKIPFAVMVRYREVTQPQQYHSQEAEVSAQFTVKEGDDAEPAISGGLSMVKKQVRIALGLEAGPQAAVATDPAKRGPGRPKKTEPTPAEEAVIVKGTTAPEPAKVEGEEKAPASDDDFGDTTGEPAKEITDADVQAACRNAVQDGKGALVAADVKNLARLKYGTDKVVAIKQEERAKFIADLKNLVAEKTKK